MLTGMRRITGALGMGAVGECVRTRGGSTGMPPPPQFTCFTGTKVHVLTQDEWGQHYLAELSELAGTRGACDDEAATILAQRQVLTLAALLAQKCKY